VADGVSESNEVVPKAKPGGRSAVDDLPTVTVLLPIRNEATFIKLSLQAVADQNYPSELMEVLVLDGMSEDGTREIVTQFLDKNPDMRIRLLDNPERTVPSALNLGLAQARGEVIVRVDGHTLIAPDYVSEGVATLIRSGAECVGGLMRPVGHGWIGETIALAHSLRFGLGGGAFHHASKEIEADTVYMGIFRRDVFDRVGLFDVDLWRNQDIEMNGRIRHTGGRVLLSPRICSTYFPRGSLRALWKQNFANGLWLIPTIRKTPGALSYRHFVPLAFVSALVVSAIAWRTLPVGGVMLTGVLGCYFLALLIATAVASARHGWHFAFSLPIVFVTLHLSYGAGSIAGFFRAMTGRLSQVAFTKTY